jgi:hypothetical protein
MAVVIRQLSLIYFTENQTIDINSDESVQWTPQVTGAFVTIIVASVVGELMGVAGSLALERDWVVALCRGNSETLSSVNATMRR